MNYWPCLAADIVFQLQRPMSVGTEKLSSTDLIVPETGTSFCFIRGHSVLLRRADLLQHFRVVDALLIQRIPVSKLLELTFGQREQEMFNNGSEVINRNVTQTTGVFSGEGLSYRSEIVRDFVLKANNNFVNAQRCRVGLSEVRVSQQFWLTVITFGSEAAWQAWWHRHQRCSDAVFASAQQSCSILHPGEGCDTQSDQVGPT